LIGSAQIVGTVHNTRNQWIPYYNENNMQFSSESCSFTRSFHLSNKGGRNGDGTYVIRFFINHDIDRVYKYKQGAGVNNLITGSQTDQAGNVVFRVLSDGDYQISFDPWNKKFSISPPVNYLTEIESVQLNGFVYDDEDEIEKVTNKRTLPAQKWDETNPNHNMERQPDGSWKKTVKLIANGGMHPNGIYQFLFSVNHISDWGYCALNGKEGQLCGGSGYDSKQGRIIDSPIVFQVVEDGEYIITMHPKEYWYTIDPPVENLNKFQGFEINASFERESWDNKQKSHSMTQEKDGTWTKTFFLDAEGGSSKNGTYCFDFSISRDWDLDGITCAAIWGKTWHSLPNTPNINFRVFRTGEYKFTLDPNKNTFSISPPVLPILFIYSFQLQGNFSEPNYQMNTEDGITYYYDVDLEKGIKYDYRYTANNLGDCWAFSDYPYDGYRRISPHGAPPPLTVAPESTGKYRFSVDIKSGEYKVSKVSND